MFIGVVLPVKSFNQPAELVATAKLIVSIGELADDRVEEVVLGVEAETALSVVREDDVLTD